MTATTALFLDVAIATPAGRKTHDGPAPDRLRDMRRLKGVDPKKVLQAFNTWAFKREQPCDPDFLLRTVACSVERGEPVPFVLYWGKGPRRAIGAPDLTCLDYLLRSIAGAG